MTSLKHLLRAFVLLALFVCLAQGCGKSESPAIDPEPFKAAVAQYLDQNNMAMALKQMGVSNFNLEQLHCLWQEARVRPRFVQNRCYAVRGWDRPVREFCQASGVLYQGFSLLTANRQILAVGELAHIAARHGRTIPQIVFRFALEAGMIPLTGTTNGDHMQADLEVFDFRLEPEEVARIEGLGGR